MLFASEEEPKSPAKKTLAPIITKLEKVDRYASVKTQSVQLPVAAPKLPPFAESKYKTLPQANSPQPVLGNRYATALTAAESPAKEPTRTEPKSDVARGQEPNNNPLRTSSPPTAPSDLGARAAFGAAPLKRQNCFTNRAASGNTQRPTI